MRRRLTYFILIGLVLGVITGWAINAAAEPIHATSINWGIVDPATSTPATLTKIAGYFSILTTIFLHLIKMIIAPLVFSTLVAGIAHMGDTKALGRIGGRTLAWFVGASLVSLTLGLILVTLLHPGSGLGLPLPAAAAGSGVDRSAFDLAKFVAHIFPESMIGAMAGNEILQIVIFSIFVGVAVTSVGEKAQPLVRAVEALAAVMLRITDFVMRFAPIAVFAAVAAALAERGPHILATYGFFIASFYLGLVLLWALLLTICFLVVGGRTKLLVRLIRDPAVLAFSTASSEAAFPRTLEALEAAGVPPKIAGFVLPLGYSFNLDGSMMYMTFASLFIAQAYGIHLAIGTQIAMLLTLMITSKGIAGVPRASLVVITATLAQFHIPEAGVLLILAVDHFLDMGRSATNVVGNAVASAVVARWEGELGAPVEIETARAP